MMNCPDAELEYREWETRIVDRELVSSGQGPGNMLEMQILSPAERLN